MPDEQNLQFIMGLIINGGNAKSDAMEAVHAAKNGDFKLANQKLKEADDSLLKAHRSQKEMLTQEGNGNHFVVSLLTIHSQDHLMNASLFRDLAVEMVVVYKKLLQASID
ncbi:PTS lactose/cellobiose transporter subunit IIA [Carnobacterium divergens]|uniref:PTS lactose/cellobiose transporter subunit IIA n=1 Tax=Carnobacterium divergens TaxID=2748 RepID=A0A2R7ZZD2_CARDV|nr:PTS lactose/cellobiose transporter subunit IIA [Carnobacterium divergens]MCO6018290.1 PTS lactose/cellobiose transporter subunit IIA [Carnobacterium divergens]MPQ21961.1 PTS lactose/cellobiose transporter subunit IIA [Carnobacterium divergens]TFI64847.1 PTS lactose/cellobiose transporter subunit IIA [Carnobacterium divergens]TFI75010.1 PTS lactose/cellobiose transporter subunit IIA [Carnobacterium divergens]TFI79373.1 PTS lactose/cellobiose transporter subunit IIA [Carnobacterium divergens]